LQIRPQGIEEATEADFTHGHDADFVCLVARRPHLLQVDGSDHPSPNVPVRLFAQRK